MLVYYLATVVSCQINIPAGHVKIQQAFTQGNAYGAHKSINALLNLRASHPDVDAAIKAGTKLPQGHINVDSYFTYAPASPPPAQQPNQPGQQPQTQQPTQPASEQKVTPAAVTIPLW